MIGYFPAPYKDEMLYSICARYAEIFKFSNEKMLWEELFGSPNCSPIVDLPACLRHLSEILPFNFCYSVKQLIENHTLFPYYRPFLEPKKAAEIEKLMTEPTALGVHLSAGPAASRVNPIKHLRFCSLCAAEDTELYGETYWHRAHHLPGVFVCHRHHVYLEETGIKRYSAPSDQEFKTADKIYGDLVAPARFLGKTDKDRLVVKIAQISVDVMNQSFPAFGKSVIRSKYLALLDKRELASYSLSLRARALQTEFLQFYPAELLSELECSLSQTGGDTKGNWLLQLLRNKGDNARHPLYHLLIIIFLRTDATDFFNLPDEISFSGAVRGNVSTQTSD